jgi:RNA recognition motif-containing protein
MRLTRLSAGNMPYSTTSAQIQELCTKVGDVVSVSVLQDSLGRSKGCATVEFSSADSAKKAISTLHDTPLNGRCALLPCFFSVPDLVAGAVVGCHVDLIHMG